MDEEERPPEHIMNDDFEIEIWWQHRNNPTVNRMRTSTKNTSSGNVESFGIG